MDGPVFQVTMPQWTHADFPPGRQAGLIAAKARLQYKAVLPLDPLRIQMYTGDVYLVEDNGDGRWRARHVVSGELFIPPHGAEHESLPEISTQNIRVECGVVKAEGRLDGHDDEIRDLKREVKRLEAECANLRGEIKGMRSGMTWREHIGEAVKARDAENSAEIRGRMLETS